MCNLAQDGRIYNPVREEGAIYRVNASHSIGAASYNSVDRAKTKGFQRVGPYWRQWLEVGLD